MGACSRCGAQDDRHTKKCYDAMVLGIALGVERSPMYERLLKLEADNRVLRRLLHEQLVPVGRRVDDPLPEQRATEPVAAPVTQLPPDYYTSRMPGSEPIHPDRIAEIEREVEFLNAVPNLDVEVHDELNATVTVNPECTCPVGQGYSADCKIGSHRLRAHLNRDDDYSAQALDEDQADELAAAPEPEPADDTDWAKLVHTARRRMKWSQDRMGKKLGVSGRSIANWEDGKNQPSAQYHEQLRQLAHESEPQSEPVPAPRAPEPEQESPPEAQPAKTWKQENDAKIGVPGAWTKPKTLAAEQAAQEYIRTHLVGTNTQRTTIQGAAGARVWEHFVTPPELMAGYTKWAKANGKPIVPSTDRFLGAAAKRSPLVKAKRQGPIVDGKKPVCLFGVELVDDEAKPEAPTPAVMPKTKAELAAAQTEAARQIIESAREVRVEHVEHEPAEIPHSQDEVQLKLAQLKTYGIGGAAGVSRQAAQAAVDGLHPTGRDIWKWQPPESAQGISDADLDATAYQLLVKCMNGLPDEYGYDYKDDVLATNGFVQADVDSALRAPQRVEIRPESWDREKRYPILGFTKGDVQVILGMRTPAKPRVIAAYWTSMLSDKSGNRSPWAGAGGGSRKNDGLPTTPTATISRLRAAGCEIPESPDEKPVTVSYKGQDLGKIMTGRTTTKVTTQTDYQRTLRKMHAIDRREVAKVG